MPLSDLSSPSTVSPCTSNNVRDLPFGLQGPGHLCRASLLLRLRVLGPWPSPVCPLHPLFARPVCPAPAHPSQPECCFFKMPFLILQSKSDPPAALFSSLMSLPPVTPTGDRSRSGSFPYRRAAPRGQGRLSLLSLLDSNSKNVC